MPAERRNGATSSAGTERAGIGAVGAVAAETSTQVFQPGLLPRLGLEAPLANLGARWRNLSLVAQFLIVATPIMVAGMLLLGSWVSKRIVHGVVQQTAISTAFYMDNLVEPLVQELATTDELIPATRAALARVVEQTLRVHRVAAIKIWSKSGKVVHSNDAAIVGKSFPATAGFRQALGGSVYSEFDDLEDEENVDERKHAQPMMEIYSPMHKLGTNDVIGVAEFYLFASKLHDDISDARRQTALAVAGVALGMLASLYGVVRRGSTTIDEQRLALEGRVVELSNLLEQNEQLRLTLVDARKRLVGTNERVMRRIGADLHDGPAQLLGLALLRFNDVDPGNATVTAAERQEGYELLRGVLEESLEEVRNISYGIAPPHLENVTLCKAIELAVRNHERRTGSKVELYVEPMPQGASNLIKTCLYRFTQEGLSNAFRHAGGRGQKVSARCSADSIAVEVADAGPGFSHAGEGSTTGGLGLAGLRDRIESLGGHFTITSVPGQGTRLVAVFDRSLSG